MNGLPDEYTPDRFMDRYSQDIELVNNNGLLLLDLCKQTAVRILNGRAGDDRGMGKFTFVGSRGSSDYDYDYVLTMYWRHKIFLTMLVNLKCMTQTYCTTIV